MEERNELTLLRVAAMNIGEFPGQDTGRAMAQPGVHGC
jgi:hypothetical protein